MDGVVGRSQRSGCKRGKGWERTWLHDGNLYKRHCWYRRSGDSDGLSRGYRSFQGAQKGTTKGAWGMKFRNWLVRGLGVACLLLGGILLSGGVVSLTARSASPQTVTSILVPSNHRDEDHNIPSSFRPARHAQLDALQF